MTAQRILVIGTGGREHALAWRLSLDPEVERVLVVPGNPGMEDVAEIAPVAMTDVDGLIELARAETIDLVVIGPEAPLVAGLADRLRAAGIPTVGPGADAARLEGSKAFCREIAMAAGVPIARGSRHTDLDEALAAVRAADGRIVVKADGLAAGKGVIVCEDLETAEGAVQACLAEGAFGTAGHTVVLEELLTGHEVSVIALCDETAVLALPAARDHKRLLTGDLGPNTGGMGAFSPTDEPDTAAVEGLVDLVHRPILTELARRGLGFRGVLFAGIMLTPDGPRLLECNVRFGDPETQTTLPRIAVPLAPLLAGLAEGRLAGAAAELGIEGSLLPVDPTATTTVVAAAAGYPDAPETGDPITGIAVARAVGAQVWTSGVARDGERLVTAGGRVLAVTGHGPTAEVATEHAYAAMAHIRFRDMQVREDIGRPAPARPAVAIPVGSGSAA